jgi:hydroxymethylpyrimidine/phosphomethylpyrimidine kinase
VDRRDPLEVSAETDVRTPIALTIAGSDSGGGAGIQADLKTFAALGVYGATAITAITAQNTVGVRAVHALPPAVVRAQIDAVCEDFRVAAVKIGMLANAEIAEAVANGLDEALSAPLASRNDRFFVVYDPVLAASSGDSLAAGGFVEAIRAGLLPLVDCLTPNLPEAATLLGMAQARDESEMIAQGRALLAFGPKSILMKGGHLDGAEAVDLLVTGQSVHRFSMPKIESRHTHGTGCTLSSALAAHIVLGFAPPEAVAASKTFVRAAIEAGRSPRFGAGAGPLVQSTLNT